MVTSAGFNALLKVVEEPPEHLKFIFATTEPEKVIGTIRSRTHHYPFRLVPPGTLREYLGEVCRREDIPVEEGVLPLVVRAGAGSVRDSMSVMDQLLAGAGSDGVTYAMATSLLGYTDGSLLDSVVEAFATGDGAAAFEVVDRVIEGGNDPRRFVADLLERLRDLVILAAVPDAVEKGLIDAPGDVLERMQAQATTFGPAELSRAADLVNEGLTEMRGATSPRLQLELICARVLLPAAYGDERSVMARLDRLERGVNFQAAPSAAAGASMPAMAYVPGPDAHGGAAVSGPGGGGGVAAARAAARASGPAAPAPAPAAVPPAPAVAPSAPPVTPPPAVPQPAAAAPAPAPAPAPAQAPGAWPTAASAGGGRRPGGWPTAPAAGGGRPAPAAAPSPAPSAAVTAAPAPASPAAPAAGGLDPRVLWPNILEAVKNRRRFTWILLSQNAQVAGFDGTTLQLAFVNAGARDNFAGSGSEDVLRQALAEQFNVHWKVEAVVDPSGGGGGSAPAAYASAPASFAPPQPQPPAPAPGGGYGGGGHGGPSAARPAAVPSGVPSSAAAASAPAAAASPRPAAPEPPPVAPEDDIPEDDDPDLDESALSGKELLVRELGATVVDEFVNE